MKTYRPTTPSRRHMVGINYRAVLTKSTPEKKLTFGLQRAKGRNSQGRITSFCRGGGVKRCYRDVDFKYDKRDIPAKISSIEYDPNRTAFIALVVYADGEKRYVLAPNGIKVGDSIIISEKADTKIGNRLPLGKIPLSTFVHNVELKPGCGSKIGRSAGNSVEIIAHDKGCSHVKLPSGEVRKIPDNAWASIGNVSNEEHWLKVIGKAGLSRLKGKRPKVRGAAMNPCDHPHGGGEGAQGAGLRRPRNRWAHGIRGVKTRTPKKYSNVFIISRRKTKKRK